jgi:thioredoxin-related protein
MAVRFLITILLLLNFAPVLATEIEPGASLGAKITETPHWFKESFLEFEEDVAEAAAAGKRVMIYFHQEGCPYCARLVEKSFNNPAIQTYLRKNFDGITINMWGDREVVSIGSKDFTEKTFAAALKVQYTPTLLFLDEQGNTALRLDGYYPPDKFQIALRYVAEHQEDKISFGRYMLEQKPPSSSNLINEDFYVKSDQLDRLIEQANRPLAVYFETGDCDSCRILHEKILTDAPTRQLVTKMQNLQFDINSDEKLILPDGKQTTVKQWAIDLDISYTPSVIFFDSGGTEVMRIGAFMKTFHFQSVYDYVLQKAYLHEPSFQRFISERAEKIREAGFNTDIWGYESSHN